MPTATLTKINGDCTLSYPFEAMCDALPNGNYTIEIRRKQRTRSLDQNRLYWAWLQCMEEATGSRAIDFHEHYKMLFNSRLVCVAGREELLPQSTTKLTTTQFSQYMTMVQADAASSFGIKLPSPEDPFFSDFMTRYSKQS